MHFQQSVHLFSVYLFHIFQIYTSLSPMVDPTGLKSQKDFSAFFTFFKDFFVSGIIAVFAKTGIAPIERVNLLLEIQKYNSALKDKPYKGWTDCFWRLIKEEGVRSLWKFNCSNILRYCPVQAISFSVKDALYKTSMQKPSFQSEGLRNYMSPFLSGGVAGVFCLGILYPLDIPKVRRAQIAMRNQGFSALYKGFTISAAGIFIYRAFYFGGYESAKKIIQKKRKLSFLAKYGIALLTTVLSQSVAYPLDLLRRNKVLEKSGSAKMSIEGISNLLLRQRIVLKSIFSTSQRTICSALIIAAYDEWQDSSFEE